MENDKSPDDELVEELGAVLESADPVPADVLAAAKASFTWRTIDAELAALAFDSATDELAGVRSEGGDRQLTFRTDEVEIVVMVHGGDGRRLSGQLIPPQRATVELRSAAGVQTADVAADGVFAFTDIPSGPTSLRCSLGDGAEAIATDWLVL